MDFFSYFCYTLNSGEKNMNEHYEIKSLDRNMETFIPTCDYLEANITSENLRENGGTLNFSNLTYESDILLVAFDKENPIGYNSVVKIRNGYYIYQIAVKKEYQHKGAGKMMMKQVMDMAAKEKVDVVAHAMNYNEASKGMLIGLGFKKVDEDKETGNGLYILKQKKKLFRR